MRTARWAITIFAGVDIFAVTWWVMAAYGHLDTQSAIGVATVAATLISAPSGWWAVQPQQGEQPGEDHADPVNLSPRQEAAVLAQPDPATRQQIVIGDLPGQAVAWQDRTDALDRLAMMAGTNHTAVICALAGPLGIGKTQIAAAYARACVARGWPVVTWVAAETASGIVTKLDALAAVAGVGGCDTDPVQAAEKALAWMRVHPGPCLLVFDNAVDPDLIRRWTPPVGAVQTVITTTRHDFANLGVLVEVDLFTPGEAVTYLRTRTRLHDDPGAAQVAEQLGQLPLALAQAGAILGARRRYATYRAYMYALANVPIGHLLPRAAGDPYPRGAAEAILLSLEDLATADPGGHARRLLDHLAVLAPIGIDAALLPYLTTDLAQPDAPDADTVRAMLAQRSLTMPTVEPDRTVVHRLLQRVLREQSRHLGGLDAMLVSAANGVLAATVQIEDRWAARTLIAEYAEHTQTLWAQATSEDTQKQLLTLRLWILSSLRDVHDLSAAIELGTILVDDCQRLRGADHPDTLTSHMNLAGAYQAAGRLDEAITLFKQLLIDCERVVGADHPVTLTSRSNLAYTYQAAGRLDEAITLFEQLLIDCERVLGIDHFDTLTARNSFADSYQATGRLDEAIAMFEQTLNDRTRVLGPDHPATLVSQNDLAFAYQAAGRLDAAITLFEQTLDDRTRVLGPDHPETLASQNNLAYTYKAAGRLDEAIALHRRTLDHRTRVLGPDHPDTLASRNNLANAYQAAGQLDEAITLFEQLLSDYEQVLGTDHPDTLISGNNLAAAYKEAGRLNEAITLFGQLLIDCERVLGSGHLLTRTVHANLEVSRADRQQNRRKRR